MSRCNCLKHPTLDLEALHDTCDCGDPSWPRVASLHFDRAQRLALDLVRCTACGFAGSDLRLWDFGLSAAMNTLGVVDGPAVFASAVAVTKTIRVERSGTFEFLTVRCSRITHDERDLMTCLALARASQQDPLKQAVCQLVRCEQCNGTLAAIQTLGAQCSRISPGPATLPAPVVAPQHRTLH